jgi:2-oxoglutarate dehydrogenase E2 component (dihydrolipoamide succinyltransferase)
MSNKTEVRVPAVGESISQVTVSKWLVKEGDYVERDQVLAELESDKATFELNAETSGVVSLLVKEGEDVAVGAVICTIDASASAPAKEHKKETIKKETAKKETVQTEATAAPVQKETQAQPVAAQTTYAAGVPSPAAAKLIADSGITIDKINGTGKGGRITKEDVLHALKKGLPLSKPTSFGGFSRAQKKEKMSNLRKTISRRLVAAKNETAMLTTFNEVDMTQILAARNQYKDKFKEQYGISLGFMSFFTRACTIALMEFPRVNGIIEDDYIITHDYCDVGIAVSTDKGLVVPVIRNAESMSLADIELKIAELAKKAREGKLTLEEMTGGTFTISNGGVFGSLMSTPILNQPQSAILGMHKIQERPVAINGQVVIRPMMYLALSYDHRIIDGKESVSFLVRVKTLLENPSLLLYGDDPVKILLGI